MKIRPVGAKLFRADRRADMTKLTIDFRNFASAPIKFATSKSQISCEIEENFHRNLQFVT